MKNKAFLQPSEIPQLMILVQRLIDCYLNTMGSEKVNTFMLFFKAVEFVKCAKPIIEEAVKIVKE